MGGLGAKNINSTKAVVGGVQSTKDRALAQTYLVLAHLTDYVASAHVAENVSYFFFRVVDVELDPFGFDERVRRAVKHHHPRGVDNPRGSGTTVNVFRMWG